MKQDGTSLTPTLPVLVIERETSDLSIYDDLANVHLIASEFWDILDEDFLFVDASGRQLIFPTHLPVGTPPDMQEPSTETRGLLTRVLLRHADKNAVKWTTDQSIAQFLDEYRSTRKPGC